MKIDVRKLDIAMGNSQMSAEELCKRSGVSKVTISRYRSGVQNARPQTIGKIAKILGYKVEDLIQEEN